MTVKTFAEKTSARLATLMTGNGYDAGKVGDLTRSIKARGAALDVDMHSAAVAALTLSVDHRDANAMKLLLNAMPKGSRRATLAAWAAAFGNLLVSLDKDKNYLVKMQPEADCIAVDLVKAQSTPFWTAPEKVEHGAFNDAAACLQLLAFIKRAKGKNADLSPAMVELVTNLNVAVIAAAPAAAVQA